MQNIGPVVSMAVCLSVCAVWHWRRQRALASAVAGSEEASGSATMDDWDVSAQLSALAASLAQHRGLEETGGADREDRRGAEGKGRGSVDADEEASDEMKVGTCEQITLPLLSS